ncbi:MAG: ABC transporter permease [Planctomycetes bacterium]|nr:ABC transporter permease [Planctomycetota bacterium]
MNANITRALFRDALSQVVDNRVFRILFVILCVLVLPTFVIGAREDHLSILFTWDYSYEEVYGLFGGNLAATEHPNRVLIQAAQKALTDGLAGTFGILFAIAATAFFMPRMLEKGAADVVFSKPVSRFALLMTRYIAGLLFAAVLAIVMIGGMQVGFLLVSGWSDPGFLWSIPILIYVFAVVHAVSVLVGVFTRSSVAAMLVTLIFYSFNGCVHQGWYALEATQGGMTLDPEQDEDAKVDRGLFLSTMMTALDVAHFILPKTGDADFIARSVRHRIDRRGYEFFDESTDFLVDQPPKEFTRDPAATIDAGGLVWRDTAAPDAAQISLSRAPIETAGTRFGSSKKWLNELKKDATVSDAERVSESLDEHPAYAVRWTKTLDGAATRRMTRWYFESGKWLYVLEIDADSTWFTVDENRKRAQAFRWEMTFSEASGGNALNFNAGSSNIGLALGLEKRYGWTAPLKYNYFFSIGSTLAFIVVVLVLAQFKLKRIDF